MMNHRRSEHVAGEEPDHVRSAKWKVLVVEDDPDVAAALSFLIERNGDVDCETAGEPYEALLKICDNSYDLLFMDERLPGTKGTSILRQLDRHIQMDPLCHELFQTALPTVLMSGDETLISNPIEFKHFDIRHKTSKRDLPKVLEQLFAS